MEYARAGRLLARQTKAYFADVLPLARQTAEATFHATILSLRLLYFLLRPLFIFTKHLYRVLSPTLRLVLLRIWTAFRLQPARVLAIEAGLALVLLLLLILERRFNLLQRAHALTIGSYRSVVVRYRRVLTSLRAKSRIAALAFPHMLYAALALAVHVTIGKPLAPFTQGVGMILVACVRPAVRTALLLYSVDVDDSGTSEVRSVVDAEEKPALAVRHSEGDDERYSTIRRRRKTERGSSVDAVRARAASVAAEIENDGGEANVPKQSRVRINEASGTREEKGGGSLVLRTPDVAINRRIRTSVTEKEESTLRSAMEVNVLRFWIVFGLVWSARSLSWYFCPFVFRHIVARLDTALFYFFLWAQLGMTRGANVVYSVIAKIARKRWRLDTKAKGGESRMEQVSLFMRLAVLANLVSKERASDVTSTVTESGLALVGVVFLITPRMATFLGTLLIGLLVPCYLSTAALETRGSQGMVRHNWLSYWSVFSMMDATFAACSEMFGWLPLWYHVKMVIILWLQLPYYRGSVVVLDYVMECVGSALSSVRKQVVTPRKRKRA